MSDGARSDTAHAQEIASWELFDSDAIGQESGIAAALDRMGQTVPKQHEPRAPEVARLRAARTPKRPSTLGKVSARSNVQDCQRLLME